MSKTIYDFDVITNKGENVSLSKYSGKALLVVNTASKCGLTPQYEGLQRLYELFQGKLEILAFPCNQFGGQEPGSDAEIASFCDMNYKTTFPLFKKIDVNGPHEHPIYTYLKKESPGLLGSEAIKWNFTKFLLDQKGRPIERFAPGKEPTSI